MDEIECCLACGEPLRAGDLVLLDASGEYIHRACCGPERESFCTADGDPLPDGDPIPAGWPWEPTVINPDHTWH